MRTLSLICFVAIFRSVPAVSNVYANDQQTSRDATDGDQKWTASERSVRTLLSSSITAPIRSKRSDDIEAETNPLPTRHAKHRRRRRCRNRPSCFRAPASKQFPRANDTWSNDNPSQGNRQAQKLYDETTGTDYDLVAPDKNGNFSNSDIDAYEERVSDDIEFEDASTWKKDEIIDYADDFRSIYTADDQPTLLHESLGGLLGKLFQSLRNASNSRDIFKELNFVDAMNEDPCQKWLNSRDKIEQVFLGGIASLPACPCHYPSNIFYDDKIWDEIQKKHFRWRDVSGVSQRLDVYKPGASYCVRSLLTQGSGSAAAQHCCYDRRRKLLTRGSGAGTPNFVSPEISPILHERIDVLPWRLCKGDFSRYNGVRPPNNDNNCDANPDDEEYQRQIDDTKYY